MPECEINMAAFAKGKFIVTPNPVTITEIPDRCIELVVPNEGKFSIIRDVAVEWYKQLGEQLGDL